MRGDEDDDHHDDATIAIETKWPTLTFINYPSLLYDLQESDISYGFPSESPSLESESFDQERERMFIKPEDTDANVRERPIISFRKIYLFQF